MTSTDPPFYMLQHINRPTVGREHHVALLKKWTTAHAHVLYSLLGHRFLTYGDWVDAKHTAFYDRLPHY